MLTALFFVLFVMILGGAVMFIVVSFIERYSARKSTRAKREENSEKN